MLVTAKEPVPADSEPMVASTLPPEAWCARFPGPAMLLDAAGRPMAGNALAEPLAEALENGEAALTVQVSLALATCLPWQGRVQLPGPEGGLAFDVSVLPLQDGTRGLLLLGRDATLERNLTHALLASRQLYKDLVACSSDFAWETRADGGFQFVSPRGALGYAASELEGRAARSLVLDDGRGRAVPFETRVPLDAAEVWLRHKDGSRACIEVSCRPVFDASGQWLGARGVCRDVTAAREREAELARAHALLEALSRTDELTGLFNRRAFLEELNRRLRHRERHGREGALLYLDLDNFKPVNDRFGHPRGDAALKSLGALLTSTSRTGDLVGRLGGDEFVIWLEDTPVSGAEAKARKLLVLASALDAEYGVADLPLGVSIGIAVSRDGETAEALVARADTAMYRVKHGGKGAIAVAPAA